MALAHFTVLYRNAPTSFVGDVGCTVISAGKIGVELIMLNYVVERKKVGIKGFVGSKKKLAITKYN